MSKESIVFDLDDTICFPNHGGVDTFAKYALAIPNPQVIDAINNLHDLGFYVIINTARRMLTHNGDLEKIVEDVGEVTKQWLAKYNVKYDELQFGKPYSSTYYVDDKAMNIREFLEWVEL